MWKWNGWRQRDYTNRGFTCSREGKEKQREAMEVWMDNVREVLQKKNIDLTRIDEATRNREVWRSLVRASSSVR